MANEIPHLDAQREFYDQWNEAHRKGKFDDISLEVRQRAIEALAVINHLSLREPRILEVGCGTGWLSERLCKVGKVTGIDLSPKAIDIARRRNASAEFIAGDFYDHDFGNTLFDLVVCAETLFYVHDQQLFMAKLASLVNPGGFLVLTMINKFVYDRRSDIAPPGPGQIRKWLTKREISKLLDSYFNVLKVATTAPAGDLGIMRIVNSHKMNHLLNLIFGHDKVRNLKESIGLGSGIIILAQRRMK